MVNITRFVYFSKRLVRSYNVNYQWCDAHTWIYTHDEYFTHITVRYQKWQVAKENSKFHPVSVSKRVFSYEVGKNK